MNFHTFTSPAIDVDHSSGGQNYPHTQRRLPRQPQCTPWFWCGLQREYAFPVTHVGRVAPSIVSVSDYSSPTRLGLLVLDSIDNPHRSIAGDYEQLFRDIFEKVGAEIIPFDARHDALPAHDECTGWVIPGSRQSVSDDDSWISELRAWISTALGNGTPLAGVCFGHQLIAAEMGAEVGRASGGWNIGVIDYEVTSSRSWLETPDRYSLLASHQDQVLTLPREAELLATAPTCPVGAYTVSNNVMCIQGHIEFVPELAASLYRSRIERIGSSAVDAALGSLDRPLDRAEVARWLLQTIEQSSIA
ncbi:MAG: hypothetical protein CL460_06380 [Acidimicrobiaceae bacterium]|nr:hypothetical protein [Acidimicrobiaceae bacterium]